MKSSGTNRIELAASAVAKHTAAAYNAGCRVIANKGGTRSGKTFSVLTVLLSIVWLDSVLVSVVSESYPHLKRGAIRDFERILNDNGIIEGKHYTINRSDMVYKFPSGGVIEFFSADNAGKVHGAQRDILFLNECNHISFEIYRQLAVRTAKTVFLDWNPTAAFWFDDKLQMQPTTKLIHSTYLDNPFLTAEQVAEIESNKEDANWWRVYGLGENGSAEGLIYSRWDIVKELPEQVKRYAVGIDFGYNDPTAVVKVALQGGDLWLDEVLYRRGCNNADIAQALKRAGFHGGTPIVADSAEPKSIAEINAFGFNVQPSVKGADSVKNGIQNVARYKLHVTANSTNIINELRNYQWRRDINGNSLNVPEHAFSHSMDALRYCVSEYFNLKPRQGKTKVKWQPSYTI